MPFWLSNQRLRRFSIYLVEQGPRWVAHLLIPSFQKQEHDGLGAFCLPCIANARIKQDGHAETTGPSCTLYCSKCGIDKQLWPKFCANRVIKVNNPRPRGNRTRYIPIWG